MEKPGRARRTDASKPAARPHPLLPLATTGEEGRVSNRQADERPRDSRKGWRRDRGVASIREKINGAYLGGG